MSFTYIKGDLLELIKSANYQNFVHGLNCFNTMGAGVAKIIRTNIVDAYRADNATARGDKSKLGKYTSCLYDVGGNYSVKIINAYTQYRYGWDDTRYLDYNALVEVLTRIAEDCKGQSILMCKIGSGTAGGDWPLTSKIVEHILSEKCDVFIIDY